MKQRVLECLLEDGYCIEPVSGCDNCGMSKDGADFWNLHMYRVVDI